MGLFNQPLPQEYRGIDTADAPAPAPNLKITDSALSARGTPTGLSKLSSNPPEAEKPKMGSLVDFQKVMRAISQDTYENRQKKEGKITKGQFDASRVSGALFSDIMSNVEKKRGGSISKMYAAGMDAGTEMIKMDAEARKEETRMAEEKRQFDIKSNLEKEKYYAEHPELNYGFSKQDGMRTDRHNNPAAFTIDIAKQAGLVEGVDYVRGDAFPDNPNMFTAKLLGNPIETTMRVISKIGFMTQSGQNRWTYTDSIPGANNEDWQKLSFQEKAQVIKDMYRHEGGNGSIFGVQPGDNVKLTPQQNTIVNSIAGAFDNEAAVKTYNVLQAAIQTIRATDNNTKNPADDQQLIYQFAKVMDPDSVVRESEYDTVQQYAQALLTKKGMDIKRVFDANGFLTPEARENLKTVIERRFESQKKLYDKIYDEYGRRINERLNINDGSKYITQYSLDAKEVSSKEVESAKSQLGISY